MNPRTPFGKRESAVCMSWILVMLLGTTVCAEDRRFTVRDSIEMARFSDPYTRDPGCRAKASPDGRYFAIVTSRGLLSDRIESTLSIFGADEVRVFLQHSNLLPPPRPTVLARFAAIPRTVFEDSYSSIISDIRWSAKSRMVYFLAQNEEGEEQLYLASLADGKVKNLTPRGYSVRTFDVSSDDSVVVYAASQSKDRTADEYFRGEVLNINAAAITDLPVNIGTILFEQNRERFHFLDLGIVRRGKWQRIKDYRPALDDYRSNPFSLSPDGRFLVELLPISVIPATWDVYEPLLLKQETNLRDPALVSPFSFEHLVRYSLIDLASGKIAPLVDGPVGMAFAFGDATRAVWSKEGVHVLLTNTFALQWSNGWQPEGKLTPCAAAVVEIRSHSASCVVASRFSYEKQVNHDSSPVAVRDAWFGSNHDEVLLRLGWYEKERVERYQYEDGVWKLDAPDAGVTPHTELSARMGTADATHGLSLWVNQGLNIPPTLWATDAVSGRSGEIWDPNPQLKQMKFGEVSVYRWRDRNGHEWVGGLVRPPEYTPGRKYPLVIQTHGFEQNEFLSDGSYTTAMAAMPMASAGMVVLQIPDRHDHNRSAQEATDHVASFEAAIDQLVAEGIVDPRRVGIIGFSRTCYYVETALIRAPNRFAAATLADGVDGSYMEHMLFRENLGGWDESIYGAKPFGQGLRTWMDSAPNFHLDAVLTPLRIEAIGLGSLLGEWELYSSLKEQRKPVDLIYIPDGQHILQKPLDRMASQQGNVDWFRFWLQGYEDPAPEKKGQYDRWRKLRRQL